MAEWIPCKERTPNKPGTYLVSGNGKVWMCRFLNVTDVFRGWSNPADKPRVQAWMPLPEPFREES